VKGTIGPPRTAPDFRQQPLDRLKIFDLTPCEYGVLPGAAAGGPGTRPATTPWNENGGPHPVVLGSVVLRCSFGARSMVVRNCVRIMQHPSNNHRRNDCRARARAGRWAWSEGRGGLQRWLGPAARCAWRRGSYSLRCAV